MVAGRLAEKNGYFYIVLSYNGPDGKRVQKWQGTGLPVKGNKKKAEDLLRQARHSFAPPAPDRSTDLSPDMLFSDYISTPIRCPKSGCWSSSPPRTTTASRERARPTMP